MDKLVVVSGDNDRRVKVIDKKLINKHVVATLSLSQNKL